MLHGSDDFFVVPVDFHVGDGVPFHGIPVEGVGGFWSGSCRLHPGPDRIMKELNSHKLKRG